jgi:beta-lactamase class A
MRRRTHEEFWPDAFGTWKLNAWSVGGNKPIVVHILEIRRLKRRFFTNVRRHARSAILVGMLAPTVLTLVGCGDSGSGSEDSSQLTPPVIPTLATETMSGAADLSLDDSEPTSLPTPTIVADPAIAKAIDNLLEGQRGVYGIVLTRPDGSIAYQDNADTPFVAASLYKLILLANIYEKREAGELTFDQKVELLPEYFPEPDDFADSVYNQGAAGSTSTIEELVFQAGAFSSNVAAKALLSLTSYSSLDKTTVELGLADTYLFIDPNTLPDWKGDRPASAVPHVDEALQFVETEAEDGPLNITTPRDMYRYFQMILDGEVINPDVSNEILDILKQQMVDDRFPYLLPHPAEMAHKTGNLEHVVHDVGIIWTPEGPVILAAMIEDPPDDDRATQIIQRLALIAYGEREIPPFTKQAVETMSPADQSPNDGEATSDD